MAGLLFPYRLAKNGSDRLTVATGGKQGGGRSERPSGSNAFKTESAGPAHAEQCCQRAPNMRRHSASPGADWSLAESAAGL